MDPLKITEDVAERLSIEQLKILDNKLDDLASEIDKTWDFSRPFTEYQHEYRYVDKAAGVISREINMKSVPKMEPHDNIGDLFTMEDFKADCESGGFINYDGFGYYATDKKQSNIKISPSHFKTNKVRSDFSHVMWYNR